MKTAYVKFFSFLAILLLTIFIAWNLTSNLLRYENKRHEIDANIQILVNQIEEIIHKRIKICETLAKNKTIIDIFTGVINPVDRNVHQILRISNEISHTELIYLINRQGISIESSGSQELRSLVGQDYSFRPYFQKAMEGKVAVFPAVGVVTKTRGLHLSAPTYSDGTSEPVGVVAMKIGVSEIEFLLKEKDEKIGILSPEGIIFATNQPEWLMKKTRDIPEQTQNRIKKTRQYNLDEIKPLNLDFIEENITINDRRYFVSRAALPILGWELVSCSPKDSTHELPILYKRLLGLFLGITGGLAILIFFLLENIQYRKKTEKMLIDAENRYKNIFDNAVMGIYQSSFAGEFLDVSPSMAEILGYKNKEELISQKNTREIYRQKNNRISFIEGLKKDNQVKDFETQLIKKDGTPIWVTLSGRLAGSQTGEPIIEGFCLDITEKKRALEDLKRERDIFLRVMETSPVSIMLIDAQRHITFANAYAEKFLELKKQTWADHYENPAWDVKDIHGSELSEEQMPLSAVISSKAAISDARYAIHWPDGRKRLVSTAIAPLFDPSGQVTEMVVVLDDITDKVRAEQEAALRQKQLYQADRMISMGILAAGVAHEINNPNTFILSNAEMLKESWKESKSIMDEYYRENGDFLIGGMNYTKFSVIYPDLCTRIIDGSRRIKRIVKELKFFSRQDSVDINEEININGVINSAEVLLSNMIKRSTGYFEKILDDDLPTIKGNSQRLEQVMVNIIQNACQSLSDPAKEIVVRTEFDKDNNKIVITCEDQGCGIQKDILKHIKDPFFTTKRDAGGTGLGLSVSETIVREFNGAMDFESVAGSGTKVILTFPLV